MGYLAISRRKLKAAARGARGIIRGKQARQFGSFGGILIVNSVSRDRAQRYNYPIRREVFP